jgi:transcription elongation GreA/GreB family factor
MEKNKKMTLMTENGEIDTFTIVGPGEVNNETGHISFDSPIGMAIKGKKLNEICRVKLDHARFEIKILDVK